MYMLAGLRTLFLRALNSDSNTHYSKLALIEQWNKECDKVFEYKNEIVRETYYKTAPKVGTWIKAECSEKNGNATCSVCGHWDWSDCNYCSNCGAKMK